MMKTTKRTFTNIPVINVKDQLSYVILFFFFFLCFAPTCIVDPGLSVLHLQDPSGNKHCHLFQDVFICACLSHTTHSILRTSASTFFFTYAHSFLMPLIMENREVGPITSVHLSASHIKLRQIKTNACLQFTKMFNGPGLKSADSLHFGCYAEKFCVMGTSAARDSLNTPI